MLFNFRDKQIFVYKLKISVVCIGAFVLTFSTTCAMILQEAVGGRQLSKTVAIAELFPPKINGCLMAAFQKTSS